MDTIPFKLHDPDAMMTEAEGIIQLYDDALHDLKLALGNDPDLKRVARVTIGIRK